MERILKPWGLPSGPSDFEAKRPKTKKEKEKKKKKRLSSHLCYGLKTLQNHILLNGPGIKFPLFEPYMLLIQVVSRVLNIFKTEMEYSLNLLI